VKWHGSMGWQIHSRIEISILISKLIVEIEVSGYE
jgi:hypothetical protein